MTEVVAGRVDFSPQTAHDHAAAVNDGKLIALAVSAHKRIASMPNVPTTIEAGLKADSVYPFYSGLFLPAKTPRAIVERLLPRGGQGDADAGGAGALAKLGVEPMPMNLEQFAKFFREDVAAAQALVEAAKIQRQ